MTYPHYAFLSYCWRATTKKRREEFRFWVTNSFKPLLEEHLTAALGWSASVFVDLDCQNGDDYQQQIVAAHQNSALLVPVLDAHYFHSPWCRAEWEAFARREQETGHNGLIYPLRYSDGDTFSDDAKRRSPIDVENHGVTAKTFSETKDYVEFEKFVKRISGEIAERIKRAPPWSLELPKLVIPPNDDDLDPMPPFGVPRFE